MRPAKFFICASALATVLVFSLNHEHYYASAFTTSSSRPVIASKVKLHSAVEGDISLQAEPASPSMALVEQFINHYVQSLEEGNKWANEFGFAEEGEEAAEGAFYSIFRAIRHVDAETNGVSCESNNGEKLLGLSGTPFYIPGYVLAKAEGKHKNTFCDFFHFPHLAKALEEDFLDAQRGSTDNRKGWQVAAVSQPTGSSFNDARMTLPQVLTALEAGTVIFNNIGAHIPRLAGPTLASTDALSLPGALNMYVTAKGMRTSAPPHTDRQDVLVVQMEGAKRWRVFTPPTDGDVKPTADPFARGKGDDSLPLHTLLDGRDGRLGSELLMDVVTREGDILFIPAGFPHTTDTVEESNEVDYDTSIHLTFNIDTHVWDLDYLGVRNAALQRNKVKDVLSPSSDNRYVGKVNQLPESLRSQLMDALPLEFLDINPSDSPNYMKDVAQQLAKRCNMVDEEVGEKHVELSEASYVEALERIHSYGSAILDIHRDMYLAAVEEGRLRIAEAAMTAHLNTEDKGEVTMTQERLQRLSLFRVRPFFEQIDVEKKDLNNWCVSGEPISDDNSSKSSQLDPNWQFTSPLKVGDEVEADLGGAFFAGKIAQVTGNTFNVVFFDGDRENGLTRDQIKLLNPPSTDEEDDFDTTGMTPKEIKRMRKKMEKKKRK
ncbi:hypothetical protein ACHAWC_011004 [Mediolabrus comicus]